MRALGAGHGDQIAATRPPVILIQDAEPIGTTAHMSSRPCRRRLAQLPRTQLTDRSHSPRPAVLPAEVSDRGHQVRTATRLERDLEDERMVGGVFLAHARERGRHGVEAAPGSRQGTAPASRLPRVKEGAAPRPRSRGPSPPPSLARPADSGGSAPAAAPPGTQVVQQRRHCLSVTNIVYPATRRAARSASTVPPPSAAVSRPARRTSGSRAPSAGTASAVCTVSRPVPRRSPDALSRVHEEPWRLTARCLSPPAGRHG